MTGHRRFTQNQVRPELPILRPISVAVPHSWAFNGYQDLMVHGQGLPQVLPEIGVLVAFALVFFVIAVWRFDFED